MKISQEGYLRLQLLELIILQVLPVRFQAMAVVLGEQGFDFHLYKAAEKPDCLESAFLALRVCPQ